MIFDRLNDEYFNWLYRLVCGEQSTSYKKLLKFLHNKDFNYSIPLDENRYLDGIEMRYYFGDAFNYSQSMVSSILDNKPCSMLEMMVALSDRCERDIMQTSEKGYCPDRWFFAMINSLGLADMDDDHFVEYRASNIIDIFLNRDYESNGKGGLFTLRRPKRDLRNVEIWCQLMWYLNELEEENG